MVDRKVTPPTARVPIGETVLPNGQRVEVALHAEYVRFFADVFRRIGGTLAPSNDSVPGMIEAADTGLALLPPAMPFVQPDDLFDAGAAAIEALRAEVFALRTEVAGVQVTPDIEALRAEIADLRATIAALQQGFQL